MPIRFASNLFWQLNDTLGYFIERGLTDNVEYVAYDTSYITGGGHHDLVPTTNISSMTDNHGVTSNWIAPVRVYEAKSLYYIIVIGMSIEQKEVRIV